ncbi:TLDc domain-containing protein [Entamoeba marina]
MDINISKIENHGTIIFNPSTDTHINKLSDNNEQFIQLKKQIELLEKENAIFKEKIQQPTPLQQCNSNDSVNQTEEQPTSNIIQIQDDVTPMLCSSELLNAFNEIQSLSNSKPQTKTTSNFLNEEELKQLKEWTETSDLNVIFDSEGEQFNRYNCSKKIFGKMKIFIILQTINGDVFGSYHHQTPKRLGEWVHDQQHFTFSLRNPSNSKRKFDVKSNNTSALMVADYIDDDDESLSTIIDVGYLYSVTAGQRCCLNSMFKYYYDNIPENGIGFITNGDSYSIEITRIVIMN